MNYMDLGGFLRFLGQGVGPACGDERQPVAACGGLWRISDTPLRWYKVGCILQPAAQ